MVFLLQTINPIFDLAWWIVLIAFCVVAYRKYRLVTLPWLGMQWAIGLFTVLLGQYVLWDMQIAPRHGTVFSPLPAPMTLMVVFTGILASLGDLLTLLLVLSEIAFLLTQGGPSDNRSFMIRFLLCAHYRVRVVGWGAVLLTIAYPIPAIVSYFLFNEGVHKG